MALERSPALIIAELWPFFSGGLQMIEELRKHAQTARIPVLVMTAADLPDYQQRAVLSGCSGYLAKPCPSERLLAEVRRIILERMAGPWNQ